MNHHNFVSSNNVREILENFSLGTYIEEPLDDETEALLDEIDELLKQDEGFIQLDEDLEG